MLSKHQLNQYRALRQASERDALQCCLVEGLHPLQEAIACGLAVLHVACLEKAQETLPLGISYDVVSEATMKRLCTTQEAVPVVAQVAFPTSLPLPGDSQRLLVLDGLQDPGNIGTLARTALAFDVHHLVCIGGQSPAWHHPKVLRASAGQAFRLSWHAYTSVTHWLKEPAAASRPHYLACLPEDTRWPVATYQQLKPEANAVLVLGSEGAGLSENWQQARANAQKIQGLTIPTHALCESLNVAISGSIILSNWFGQ